MDIKTNEIGDLLRSQIKNINESVDATIKDTKKSRKTCLVIPKSI